MAEQAPAAPLRTCERCKLPVRQGKERDYEINCIGAQRRAMALLLEKIGTPRACRGCWATIYMVTTVTGEAKPVDPSGWTHLLLDPTSHSDWVWDDVVRMRTLNTEQSRNRVEQHVGTPTLFDIIERTPEELEASA